MAYAFLIDNRSCISCHACSVACKTEHEVPLGVARTWVKYVERGEFPETRRTFTVNRCNHCDDAPCVEICPTTALFKRPDGIVDFDSDQCIGCKGCMQACPYDAIYIDPDGELGIRKWFESPYRPGEKLRVDEYYRWIFENAVPGLPETAAEQGLTALGYMRRYGVFEIEKEVRDKHLAEVTVADGAERDTATGTISVAGKAIGVEIDDGVAVTGFRTPVAEARDLLDDARGVGLARRGSCRDASAATCTARSSTLQKARSFSCPPFGCRR